MNYHKYLDSMTIEEIEIMRLLYSRMNNSNDKLRELSDACDKRINMNKDKLRKILNSLEERGIIEFVEKSNGNKDSKLMITIDNFINK